jgi:Fe-S-cluster containining protein
MFAFGRAFLFRPPCRLATLDVDSPDAVCHARRTSMRLLEWFRGWSASVVRPPFKRTVCACPACVKFCQTKPGALIPSDIAPIGRRLVELGLISREADVGRFLRATRPSTVYDTDLRKQVQIKKIGPARDRRGRCVFLDETDRCQVHGVSPFGCAFFDAHQDRAETERRQLWSLRVIRASKEYQALRETLPLAEGGKNESY